jgi:hypothetical protein
MKMVRTSENVAGTLLIVALGSIIFTFFYHLGLLVLAWVGLGLIPFCFGCWALSLVLAGPRDREISAHLTASEREQVREMVRAYCRRIALGLVPVVVLASMTACCLLLAHPGGPDSIFDYLMGNQVQLMGAGLGLVVALVLASLPVGIKQRRAMRDFLLRTEYAWSQANSTTQR